MKLFRSTTGGLAVLALAAALAATAPAEARDRLSPGAAAALGVLGGLAVGGAIAATAPPVYAAPEAVYVAPPPPPRRVYYAPPSPVVVEERCWVERSREWVPGWGWQFHRRTVCD